MDYHSTALRRMMAERGLTLRQVVDATGLHERTVKSVLRGRSKPHARTLHTLAVGLGAEVREFFLTPDTTVAVVVPLAEKPVVERVMTALQGDYRDLLLGTLELITRQAAKDPEPCAVTS